MELIIVSSHFQALLAGQIAGMSRKVMNSSKEVYI